MALVRAIEQDEDRHILLGERQSSSAGQTSLLARFAKPSIFSSRMGATDPRGTRDAPEIDDSENGSLSRDN